MVETSKRWYVTTHFNNCPNYDCTFTDLYTIGKDTIINGLIYYKVYLYQNMDSIAKDSTLYGLIRETSDKKVFLLKDKQEQLYYNFDLKVNDIFGNYKFKCLSLT